MTNPIKFCDKCGQLLADHERGETDESYEFVHPIRVELICPEIVDETPIERAERMDRIRAARKEMSDRFASSRSEDDRPTEYRGGGDIWSVSTTSTGEFIVPSKYVSVSLTPEARDALRAYAKNEQLSLSDAVLKAVERRTMHPNTGISKPIRTFQVGDIEVVDNPRIRLACGETETEVIILIDRTS